MMRVNVLILDKDLAVVTKEIGSLGLMHLVEVGETPGLKDIGWTPGEELGVVNRYQSAKRQLDDIFNQTQIKDDGPYVPVQLSVNPLKDIDDLEEKIDEYYEKIRGINENIFKLRDKLAYEQDNLNKAEKLIGAHADVALMRELKTLKMFLGYLPVKSFRNIEENITTKYTTAIPIETSLGGEMIAFFCLPEDAETLEDQLKSIGFESVSVPEECSGPPEDAIQEIEGRIEKIRMNINEEENKLRGFGWTNKGELMRIREHLVTNLDILTSVKSMGLSERTALISGWVPEKGVEKLRSKLKETLEKHFYMSATKPEEIEEVRSGKLKVPVIFKNPKILAPFETLVKTYGSPDYSEIEPSAIIAIAFLLMFGVMFGDVGHGLVLTLLGWFMKKKVKATQDMGHIMTMAGVSSMTFGFFFGEIFGYPIINHPLVFHPISHINPFMAVAVAYGIIFISIGLILNVINSIIVRDIERGFLENHGLAGAFFYWGALAILVKYIVDGKIGIPIWGALLIVGVPLFVIFMREPIYHLIKGKRPLINEPGSYFLGSIVEILDTFTGFLSNTVSFIRIAAFSLAHIALMTAIFALMSTIQSGAVSFIVQVGGNILVIALEGLVVSIQSVRLIYYEFFSKFYSGEGESFSPMKIGVLTSRGIATE